MKYKTLKNMEKATQMIAAKGYDWETANDLAIKSFENVEANNFYHPVEYFIDKISSRAEYESVFYN